MRNISTTKVDDFSIAMNRGVIILSAVLPEESLHQPRFGELRRNIENSIEKDFRDFPSFLGNGSRRVPPINPNNRVLGLCFWRSRLRGFLIDIQH